MKLGELRYAKPNGSYWVAEVEKATDDATGLPGFSVRISNGSPVYRNSGFFHTGAACAQFVRNLGKTRFPGVAPEIDTLHKIAIRKGTSLVPSCFRNYSGGEIGKIPQSCQACVYSSGCARDSIDVTAQPGVEKEEDQQTAEELARRVQEKLAKLYGTEEQQ